MTVKEDFRRLEAVRRRQIWTMSLMTASLGGALATRFHDPQVQLLTIIATVVVLSPFVWSVARRRSNARMASVAAPTSGTWLAAIPSSFFYQTTRTAMFIGHITFDAAGATWRPGSRTARNFLASPIHWESTCSYSIRPLAGLGGLMQLDIDGSGAHPPTSLRLFRAGKFPNQRGRAVKHQDRNDPDPSPQANV